MRRTFVPFLITALFLISTPVFAATPTLSLAASGYDNVQLRIQGDPRSTMKLKYTNGDGVDKLLSLGTTDSEGFLSATVSTSANGIVPNSLVQVLSVSTNSLSSARHWPIYGSTSISFDVSSVHLPVGQNTSVAITNPLSSSLVVKANTNSNAVSATIEFNRLVLGGRANGAATVTVCTSDGTDCEGLPVTVGTGSPTAPSNLQLSQTAPVIIAGNTANVYISGPSDGYYVSSNSSPSVAQASLSQNLITITALAAGSTKIIVCGPAAGCGTLSVSVLPDTPSNTKAAIVLNPTQMRVAVGDTETVLVAGSGTFTASSNALQIASTTITQNTHVQVIGKAVGTATITVCDNNSNCDFVSVKVTPAPVTPPPTTPSTPSTPTTAVFSHFLTRGSSGSEVLALQKKLAALGYLKAVANGYFGPSTTAAVKAFQKAHGLTQAGYVGPSTRAALNK